MKDGKRPTKTVVMNFIFLMSFSSNGETKKNQRVTHALIGF